MRYYVRRLFVVFLCLSVLFSSTCIALANEHGIVPEENHGEDFTLYDQLKTDSGEFKVSTILQFGTYDGSYFSKVKEYLGYSMFSGSLDKASTTTVKQDYNAENPATKYWFRDQYVVASNAGIRLARKGENLSFTLDNVYSTMFALDSDDNITRYSNFNPNGIEKISYYVYGRDPNAENKRLSVQTSNFENIRVDGNKITIGANFDNVPFDVYQVNIVMLYQANKVFNNNNLDDTLTSTSWNQTVIKRGWGYENSTLSLITDENTAGLLSSIIGFIQSILDGIINIFNKLGDIVSTITDSFSSLFTKLGNWFSNLVNTIIELPKNIWEWIENGLKALFIPSVDYMDDYQDKFSDLFKDRFGLLYDCVVLIDEFFSSLDISTKQNYIEIPSVTVDLAGEDFTFGGYEMQIVPNKFEFLANAVKTLVSIVCTFGFIIVMKNRFTRLLERG